jgi:hypothetical protein
MSDLYPNLGSEGHILDIAAAADLMVDDGVGPESVRISTHAQPDTTGVAHTHDINTEFVPHSRKAPPAPKTKKEKKNKGGRKKSRRLTKRKKRRKRKKTRKHRGGMFPSNTTWVQLKDDIFFPPGGYRERGKSDDYLLVSNSIMRSEQGNILGKKAFSSEVTLQSDNIPGMPGGAIRKYKYEIMVYIQTIQIKTVCITISEDIGGRMETRTHHGVDDLLLWVLFKIAIMLADTSGATIITDDNMRFIQSGSEIDRQLYRDYNSKIREKIKLDEKQNLIIPA